MEGITSIALAWNSITQSQVQSTQSLSEVNSYQLRPEDVSHPGNLNCILTEIVGNGMRDPGESALSQERDVLGHALGGGDARRAARRGGVDAGKKVVWEEKEVHKRLDGFDGKQCRDIRGREKERKR